jgi:hypothetical protein
MRTGAIKGEVMFMPGPLEVEEPLYTIEVMSIERYTPESITAAVVNYSGARLLSPALPRWEDWQAAWEACDRMILLDRLYTFDETGEWGALRATCDCWVSDFLGLWGALRQQHPGVWAYRADHTQRMYSPDSFRFGPLPPLQNHVLAWNDGTVRRISEGVYAERAFDRLPILADALLDAGCDDEELLAHCRSEGPHVRGCWALDRILGKE